MSLAANSYTHDAYRGSATSRKRQDRSVPRTPPSSAGVAAFELTDSGESFHVTARLPQRVWLALLLGFTSLGDALLADGVEAEGDLAAFTRFHRRFNTAPLTSPARAGAERALPTPARPVEGETP